ncbi:hypothetical protein I6E29_02305 [Arcanobacterium haemolyticum]|nr:hypothetical protein [Arcanobacterium haemolyticum]
MRAEGNDEPHEVRRPNESGGLIAGNFDSREAGASLTSSRGVSDGSFHTASSSIQSKAAASSAANTPNPACAGTPNLAPANTASTPNPTHAGVQSEIFTNSAQPQSPAPSPFTHPPETPQAAKVRAYITVPQASFFPNAARSTSIFWRVCSYRGVTIVFLLFFFFAGVWLVCGPEGPSALDWQLTPLLAMICVAGVALTGFLAVFCGFFAVLRHLPKNALGYVLGAMLSLVASAFLIMGALGVVIAAYDSDGAYTPTAGYYERNLGFPDPSYTYYRARGLFAMDRDGTNTGEQRWDGKGKPGAFSDPTTNAGQGSVPAVSPTPSDEAASDAPLAAPNYCDPSVSVDADAIEGAASIPGAHDIVGVAIMDSSLGGNGIMCVARSDDGGNTWTPVGEGVEGSFYAFVPVDADTFVLGLGTSDTSAPPPIFVTTNSGQTWVKANLPLHDDEVAHGFLESAERVGDSLVITTNYPSWVSGDVSGLEFQSKDGGITWLRNF